MASGIEELLDMLFDMIDEAKGAAFSNDKCIIERDRALDIIDDIRGQFPMELDEAKKLLATRSDMISAARREADAIRKSAEDRARQLVSEDALVVQARNRANEIIQQAEERCRDLKRSANEYCEDALRRTEDAVADAYDELKQAHTRFRATVNALSDNAQRSSGGGRTLFNAEEEDDI